MVTPMLPPDQTAVALVPKLLGDELRARQHHVDYVTFYPRDVSEHDMAAHTTYVTPFFRGRNRLNRFRIPLLLTVISAAFKIKRIVEKSHIVHIHSYTPLTYPALSWAKFFRKPTVILYYGTEIWYYKPRSPRYARPFYWVNRLVDQAVYYSKGLMDYSERMGIAPRSRTVIYPPVNEAYHPIEGAARSELKRVTGMTYENNLVCTKDLHEVGGHQYLIRAMPRILEMFPHTGLFLFGGGPLQEELAELAGELGVAANVFFKGWVPNVELGRFYAAADLSVLSSVLESYGNVIVESLACGTPVVATATVGATELQGIFSEDIVLAPLRSPEGIAEAVIENLEYKRRVGEETTARIEKEFSVKAVADRYLELYQELLASRS